LRGADGYNNDELDNLMATFFAMFNVNNEYLTSRDAEFLQRALDIFVGLFQWVRLKTNMPKLQTMICTPDQIWTHFLAGTHHWLQRG
jgi:hypothetical protein